MRNAGRKKAEAEVSEGVSSGVSSEIGLVLSSDGSEEDGSDEDCCGGVGVVGAESVSIGGWTLAAMIASTASAAGASMGEGMDGLSAEEAS